MFINLVSDIFKQLYLKNCLILNNILNMSQVLLNTINDLNVSNTKTGTLLVRYWFY
jgi:hypothetical protein